MAILDIYNLTERVEELRSERDDFVIGAPDGTEEPAPEQWAEENPEEAKELAELESLLSELAGNGGDYQWESEWYPNQLIAENEFTDYCEEMLKDIGDLPKDLPSYIVIDWEATAKNLSVDYSSVTYEGEEYYYR